MNKLSIKKPIKIIPYDVHYQNFRFKSIEVSENFGDKTQIEYEVVKLV